jgi:hypothetical protein
MSVTGVALASFSALVARLCTPHASTPVASSSAAAPPLGGHTRAWPGSAAASAALPTTLISAML